MSHRRLVSWLLPLSTAYLLCPYLLFFAGWLRWGILLIAIPAALVPLILQWREARREVEEQASQPRLTIQGMSLLLLAAILFVGISGIGGYGYQDSDWLKHNALLKDLVERPWPVVTSYGSIQAPLVYYIAYYLPAAFVGKIAGWTAANHTLFLWSLAGVLLAMMWFIVLAHGVFLAALGLFVFFSGLDVVGMALVTPRILAIKPEFSQAVSWLHIEPWAIGWQYSSHTTQLFWVPNQALAGWIATAILAYTMINGGSKKFTLFIWALTVLWSPFITLGLLPVLAADFISEPGAWCQRLRSYFTLPNLCGLLILALVAAFYAAKIYPPEAWLGPPIPHGFSLTELEGAYEKFLGLLVMLVFIALEAGLYALMLLTSIRGWSARTRALAIASIVWLAILPIYRYGAVNDLAMRASIPALFMMAILVSKPLSTQPGTYLKRGLLTGLLLLGSVTALIEIHRHIMGMLSAGKLVNIPDLEQVASLWEYALRDPETLMRQYFGSSEAFFFRYLAR